MFMDSEKLKKENKVCKILSGDEVLIDILQLLKELQRLSLAANVIQDEMRQNTPTTIKTSVGEAVVFLDSLLNTQKCLNGLR